MHYLLKYLFFHFALILPSQEVQTKNVCDSKDYENYLAFDTNEEVKLLEEEFNFWNTKFLKAPNQYTYLVKMADAQSELFRLNGDISYITQAVNNLEQADALSFKKNSGIQRSLAKNYITLHEFKKALSVLKTAEANGIQLQRTEKMLFDVHMEVGNYALANKYLSNISDKQSFDYLIRKAKWEDHAGNLDKTIANMHLALDKAVESNSDELIQWTITNLGDYYGHNGEIDKSYDFYLKALAMDPSDAYAKKGIAWIAFSNDRNSEEALRIIDAISSYHNSPDYLLFKADIAEFNENEKLKDTYLKSYFNLLDDQKVYDQMYAKHNVLLYAENPNEIEKAFKLAYAEIALRPTAQSYSLLAHIFYKQGDIKKALEIACNHIIDQTYEPEPLFLAAQILKKENMMSVYGEVKNDLVASVYELGPNLEEPILNL